ncbi:I78 family peptidase inhibitor [Halomonas sp. HP20-15]|uniref:I78 family peptidase inhibitor n=1 Tax=Halomonas sp. HP20-15 TaxID=3085901 RepID=UPI0029810F4A|nr:I78 family peptidase inhibitor [Halomonas sp. HP20-15]MDW5378461.1 I78 family peptidase inhibitor [Halomonas sp. HP20-15]
MTRWFWGGLPLIALLTACSGAPRPATAPEPPPLQASAPATCGADALRGHIGERLDESLREALQGTSGAQRVRIIRPGQGYTMDYRPERLNVHLDAQQRIDRLSCG